MSVMTFVPELVTGITEVKRQRSEAENDTPEVEVRGTSDRTLRSSRRL